MDFSSSLSNRIKYLRGTIANETVAMTTFGRYIERRTPLSSFVENKEKKGEDCYTCTYYPTPPRIESLLILFDV